MNFRIRLLSFFFLLCFGIIIGKLFYWQVIDRERLVSLAAQQYYTDYQVSAPRGKILTADNFPLVLNRQSYLLYVNPQELEISPEKLKEKLEGIVDTSRIDQQVLREKKLVWFALAKDLTEEKKQAIEKLQIKGLGFEEGETRFYPEASMSAQLLGFVGESENGEKKGYFGLEGYYDHELRGQPGRNFFEKDALGRPMFLTGFFEEQPIAGRNLLLNLDRALQYVAEKHLKEGVERYGASSGLVLIMNPKTGAVLAMAAFPSYDPATYFRFEPDLFRNPVISSVFEPGSIFKVIVMASALEAGAVEPDEICTQCNGPRQIHDYSIQTWNDKYFPDSSMTDIIVHSDNVGMVYVAEKLGLERFYQYLEKFGFGKKTEIDLQGELKASLRKKEDWYEIDLATASFGQGIAVTPIQILKAVCALASGGELYRPQVVKKIFEDERSITIEPKKEGRPISAKTAKIVTQMMIEAVEKAQWKKPVGYKIAGKTGTAQVPIAGHYDPDKTVASFVGFAPADNPQFAMLVTIKEPTASPWGATTAVPIWMEIAEEIFRLWEIPPSS